MQSLVLLFLTLQRHLLHLLPGFQKLLLQMLLLKLFQNHMLMLLPRLSTLLLRLSTLFQMFPALLQRWLLLWKNLLPTLLLLLKNGANM